MFKLLRAEFARMFGSFGFMCAVLFCLFLGGIFTYMISWGNNKVFIEDSLFKLYIPVIVLSALLPPTSSARNTHKAQCATSW